MTTTHQLMAAAFCLCGLLFLLHVDSVTFGHTTDLSTTQITTSETGYMLVVQVPVNSLRCRYCSYTNPDCNSGNVGDIECEPNQLCSVIRLFSPEEPEDDGTFRGCTTEAEGLYCRRFLGTWKQCHLSCSTDNCNSASNIDE